MALRWLLIFTGIIQCLTAILPVCSFFSAGSEGLGKILSDGLPLTQNPTGSISSLPARTLGGVFCGTFGIYIEFWAFLGFMGFLLNVWDCFRLAKLMGYFKFIGNWF